MDWNEIKLVLTGKQWDVPKGGYGTGIVAGYNFIKREPTLADGQRVARAILRRKKIIIADNGPQIGQGIIDATKTAQAIMTEYECNTPTLWRDIA